MGLDIWSANDQQEPIDIKGRLYTGFKTYSVRPDFKQVRCYIDTADTGKDYLAGFVYGVTFANEAYILDLIYTKEGMEITEPETAKMLFDNQVNVAYVESNNGGRGFARSVERILRSTYNTNRTTINWFYQGKNKIARILSNATWCMEHIYFPENWKDKWPELHAHLTKYQKEGKNEHDDAEDALTGIAEDLSIGITVTPKRVNY
jgi:predicted phage terminase large subunit-like protein